MHSVRTISRELGRRTHIWVEQRGWPAVSPIFRAAVRRRRLAPGKVTIVVVAYKSLDYLPVITAALAKFPDDRIARVLIIDNASRDGTREWLRRRKSSVLRAVLLPFNVQHGPALDLGVFLADTEFFVTLDIDAFPVRDGWLDSVLEPLMQGASVAGAKYVMPVRLSDAASVTYAHPCFLGMRTARFVEEGHSFVPVRDAQRRIVLDTGARISQRESDGVHLVEPTFMRGPGPVGSVFGDAVFHLFYGTRARQSTNSQLSAIAKEAESAWAEAVDRYL